MHGRGSPSVDREELHKLTPLQMLDTSSSNFKVLGHLIPSFAVIYGFHPVLTVMAVLAMALAEIGQLYGLRSSDRDFGRFLFQRSNISSCYGGTIPKVWFFHIAPFSI